MPVRYVEPSPTNSVEELLCIRAEENFPPPERAEFQITACAGFAQSHEVNGLRDGEEMEPPPCDRFQPFGLDRLSESFPPRRGKKAGVIAA